MTTVKKISAPKSVKKNISVNSYFSHCKIFVDKAVRILTSESDRALTPESRSAIRYAKNILCDLLAEEKENEES